MGRVIDFKTGKTLSGDTPIVEQQEVFSRECTIETLVEIIEMLEHEGYTLDGGILTLPNKNTNVSPTSISLSDNGTAADMMAVMKPAFVNLVKAVKMEEMVDEPA